MIINGEKIISKLSKDDLILKSCREIAIKKLKNLNEDDNNKILNILSYDNTNPNIVYFCFKKIQNNKCLGKFLNEYKYCLGDEMDIIDYKNNNVVIHCDLKKEFNYKFTFKNITEAKIIFMNTLEYLIDLIKIYRKNINSSKII